MNTLTTDARRGDETVWTTLRVTLERRRTARRSMHALRNQLAGTAGDEIKAMLEQI